MKSLQNEYNLIKEGKGNKELFIKEARTLFPNIVTGALTFDQAIHNLNERGIISEGFTGVLSQRADEPNWFKIFSENTEAVKATLKDTDKSVVEKETAGYDYEDKKNSNNISTQEILEGYYTEMRDPKNADKTENEIKAIVFKNLEKDPMHYIKDGAFGVKGIGYTQDAPGLGPTKEVKGKYASSGMEPVKLNEAMYGSSDGDYEADQEATQMAYYYYDKGLEAYSEGDFLKADQYRTTALRHGSYLGWGDEELPPYSEGSLNESKHGDEAELGIYKSELKLINKTKPTAERHQKRKADLEKKIAALEKKVASQKPMKEIDMTGVAGSEEEEERRLGARDFKTPIGNGNDKASQVDWEWAYEWVKAHAVKWANKNGINNAGALQDMFRKESPSNMINILNSETGGKFGQLPKVKRMFQMPEGESLKEDKVPGSNIKKVGDKWRIYSGKTGKMWKAHYDSKEDAEKGLKAYFASQNESLNNMNNRTTLSEAKKRAIEKHLTEIDKLGEVATYEFKIGKIQEKIEELKNRLTMTESDDMKDVVDKKAIGEIKKDIALLEKRSKVYEAKKNNLAKKLKPNAASGNGVRQGAVGGEEMIDEAKEKAPVWQEAMRSVLKKKGY